MRYPLALAILTASMAVASLAPARAEAVFPEGPCGGLLCGIGTGNQRPKDYVPPTPQNCGGLMCDFGARAFETPGAVPPQAAAAPVPPPAPECGFLARMTNNCPPPPPPVQAQAAPPEPEPVVKHKKHKHVAAKRTPDPAATAAADPKSN